MGFVVRRGTRDNPKYYIRYVDIDGGEKTRRVPARTKADAEKFLHDVEHRLMNGRIGIEQRTSVVLLGPLMDEWIAGLDNRNAQDDRTRFSRHLRPAFAAMTIAKAQEMPTVLDWIAKQRSERKRAEAAGGVGGLSDASIRHNLNLLSRFFSWALERGHVKVNPVRMIPPGRRPQQTQKRDQAYLDDDQTIKRIMKALPRPLDLMFFIGNRSGLRTGEICGLRMSDMVWLHEGSIRVRFSYGGLLKEDKTQQGKMKWCPATIDATEVLGTWLNERRLAGAGAEDLVFPFVAQKEQNRRRKSSWCGFRKEYVEDQWADASTACKVDLTWYLATRHSFVSRNLQRGATLDEVSSAIGHASPTTTRRYYDHYVRRTFSPTLTRGFASAPVKTDETD